MARFLILRFLLFLSPFVVFAIWREVARRTGRPMGSSSWPWLITFGAALVVVSLLADAILPHGRDHGRYVPAEVRADGTVKPGHFEGR